MKVFVAGATGVLGRATIPQLRERGHDVVALAPTDAHDAAVRGLGAQPRRGDLFDAESLARAAEGCDVVLRLATRIPASGRTRRAWAENDRIRREGTAALLEASRRVGARLYAQESVAWVARPADGRPFDEASPPSPDWITASALDAERMAREAATPEGLETATLRLGVLYGPDASQTLAFADMLRRGRLPLVAGGKAPLSFLHADDAGSAFVALAERGRGGVWNVVDDEPASTARFFGGLAQRLGARPPGSVPAWLARLALGSAAVRLLTTPMATSAARLKASHGWAPRFPTVEKGLDHVAETWRASSAPLSRTAGSASRGSSARP